MERKIAGILLILLALSLEFNSILLTRFIGVSAQPEEFAKKLENYLGKAIPDDLLAGECEYVVPEGFNNTFAERLWRDMGFYASAGCNTSELRRELRKIYGNSSLVNATLSNGAMVMLNLSGVAVEREWDGSVMVKMPVVSESNLSYARYNFTKQAGFYEAWNKTLVREYRVWRREPGWYTYVFEDLESNKSFTVVSRIWGEASVVEEAWLEGLRKLGGGAWNEPVRYTPSFEYTLWGWMRVKGPVVAIPGRYEDVRVIVPQQERSFKVLFPAYDPFWYEGWTISINVSATSLSVEETLEISYLAEYCSPWGGEPEPLNATLTIGAPDSFQPLDSVERRLDETHVAGVFRLKAVKPGTYNITLSLDGNAVFSNTLSNMETYTVQVVSPPAPSLSLEIVGRDTSVLKHARLILRLRNNGGGAARNVTMVITGSHLESVVRSVGTVEAGGARDVELSLRLLQPASTARIRVAYSDDDGNPYLVGLETMVSTETFWVPERFETYTVMVPEHEETMRVFVPGFESATHIRLYALWDERIIGEAIFYGEKLGRQVYDVEYLQWLLYNRTALSLGLVPIPVPGLGVELSISTGREALTEAGVKMMVKSIEPYYEYTGVLKEDEALRFVNADKESLRNGNVSSDFKIEPLKPYWVKASSIVLNSTELVLYQAMMEGLKKKNPDFDYEFRETIADFRTRVGKAEPGYVALIYHPLKVVGEGPLKTVRVRNFAAIGFEYTVNVETSRLTFLGKAPGEKAWRKLYLDGKEDAVLLSSSLDTQRLEVSVNLTYNGRLVAKASFTLDPESSVFWRGFWDGFKGELWRIVLTGVIMVVLCVAGGGTVGAMTLKLSVLAFLSAMILFNAFTQYVELGQVLSTAFTLKEASNIIRDEARQFSVLGYHGTASFLNDAADEITHVVKSVEANFSSILDFLSRVGTDLSLWEWEVLLGLRKAEPYENGRVWGKATGIAISLVEFLAGFCYLAVSGTTSASLGAKAKTVLRGLYNWLTPAMTDAISVVRNTPKMAKGFGMLVSIISRMKELGIPVIEVLKMDAEGAINLAGIFGKVLDAAGERKISDEAVQAIRELCARAMELGEEEVKKLAGSFDTLLSKNTEFTGGFAIWARKANPSVKWVVETTGRLAELSKEELGSLRGALAKVGENLWLRLFNTYFKTADLEQGKNVANALVEAVSRNPDVLDVWGKAVERNAKMFVSMATATAEEGAQLEIGRKVEPGYYWVQAVEQVSGELMEDVRMIEEGQHAVYFKGASYGDAYVLIFAKTNPGEVLTRLRVEGDVLLKHVEKAYGLTLAVEGENVFLRAPDDYRIRVDAELGGTSRNVYVKLEFVDSKGDKHVLHVGNEGSLNILFKDTHTSVNRVYQKLVRDDSEQVVARLVYIKYMSGNVESTDSFAVSSNPPSRPAYFLDNEAGFIGVEPGQRYLEFRETLKDILGKNAYESLVNDMENGRAVVGVAYEKAGERRMRWTTSTRMELDVEGADDILGVAVARTNGLGASVGDTSLRIEVDDAGVKRLRIEAAGASRSFEVGDAGFKKPKGGIVNLEIPLKSGDAIGFRLTLGDDGKTVKVTPEVAWGEGNYDEMVGLKYEPEFEIIEHDSSVTLKDVLIMKYKDAEGEHLTIRGINEKVLERALDAPEHFIAMYYEKTRFETQGGRIMEIEHKYKDSFFDYIGELRGRKVFIEVKHGYESDLLERLKAQADEYLNIAKEENAILMYRFYDEPQSPNAKALFEYLKELHKSNRDVLKIFIKGVEWTGG